MRGLHEDRRAFDLKSQRELVGSFRKGGKVKKSGMAKVHAGEYIHSSKKEAKLRKKGMKG